MTSSLLKALVGKGTAKCYVSQNKVQVCTCGLLGSKYKRNIAHVYQLKNNKTLHSNNLKNIRPDMYDIVDGKGKEINASTSAFLCRFFST